MTTPRGRDFGRQYGEGLGRQVGREVALAMATARQRTYRTARIMRRVDATVLAVLALLAMFGHTHPWWTVWFAASFTLDMLLCAKMKTGRPSRATRAGGEPAGGGQ
jgi:hypothetical protein